MSQTSASITRKASGQSIFLAAAICVCIAAIVLLVVSNRPRRDVDIAAAIVPRRLEDIPFNGTRAYEYLKRLCDFGSRPSGSVNMAAQQKFLVDYFQKLGAKVELQHFGGKYPADGPDPNLLGREVPMANILVRWNPGQNDRILFVGHYDTLPFPLRDPNNTKGVFVGADDNASGVAILMEMAQDFAKKAPGLGVDFLLVDGEEFIFSEKDPYFLGSEYFARQYANTSHAYNYRWGVLLDMVGDSELQIYEDQKSAEWRDTRPLVHSIWATASKLGVHEFVPQVKYDMLDDHVPLHDIGKIPTCDLIDFDYPPWHTQGDTADKCSALSLAKVGWVLEEWLKSESETK